MIKDFVGQELKVGDYVARATQAYSSPHLALRQVKAIRDIPYADIRSGGYRSMNQRVLVEPVTKNKCGTSWVHEDRIVKLVGYEPTEDQLK